MFGFLNSTILVAATAAVIPLIIHLFSRRRVKVVEFSSLKHLKAMQRRQVRRLKIRQFLLLLLRMLIIFLAVLAFARPTIEKGGIGSHASVSAVIIFDNSASMNRFVTDGNLFELAKQRTLELLQTFGEADEVLLLPLDMTFRNEDELVFESPAGVREKLTWLKAGSSKAKLQYALENARHLLQEAINLNRELYIVSDRQRQTLPDRPVLAGFGDRIYICELPLEPHGNAGITAVDFGGQLIIPGHNFDIAANVKNYTLEDRTNMIASLYLDGNRMAQTDFSIDGNGETSVRFSRSVSNPGFHSGYIEISDDKFMSDNRYYFSFKIPEKFNLLIISDNVAGEFISLALAPSNTINQYWSVKTISPDNLAGVNFFDYNVIIFAGETTLSKSYVKRLESFVSRARALFVTYNGQSDIEEFNATWSGMTGVVFDEPVKQDFSRAGYYTLQSIDIVHPIFSVFNFEKDQLPEFKFYTLPKLHLSDKVQTLMRFSGDRPALVENRFGKGRVLTFTGPISPLFSDITGRAFFVPFVSRIAEYLASDLSSYDLRLFAGDNIARPISNDETFRSSLEMITPDSSIYLLSPEEKNNSRILQVQPADQPGIYSIQYNKREIDRFAVNIDPDECQLDEVTVEDFAVAVGAEDYKFLSKNCNLAAAIAELRFGKELWQLFLWAVAVLVLVEMFLSRRLPSEE